MESTIQCKPRSEGNILHHHAFIRLLVTKELEKSQVTWFKFMCKKGFTFNKDVHPSTFPIVFLNPRENVSVGYPIGNERVF